MPNSESTVPDDWFSLGDQDLRAAEILLAQQGPLAIIAFHLQQAVEKYLKGYLIAQGWHLRRIHDLETLIHETIARDESFSPYLTPCQRLTEYYMESRYPVGVSTPLQFSTLSSDFATVQTLTLLIHEKMKW